MSAEDLGASSLNLLENLGELLPFVHDLDTVALLLESLLHLLHLLFTVLNLVDTDVANTRDTSTHGRSGTRLAIFDGDAVLWLDTELFAGVEVDLGVWLAGRWVEGGGSAIDVLVGEVVVDLGFLEGSNDTGFGRGADNRHGVAGLVQALKLFGSTGA